MKNKSLVVLFLLVPGLVMSQTKLSDSTNKRSKFKYQALIIPVALIGYGVIGLESHTLKQLNSSTSAELNEHIDKRFSIDDFSQYSPLAAVYILNAAGIKGKNSFRDRTMISGIAFATMSASVGLIKLTSNELRPDKTAFNSFPSGHTATAFMCAEILFQEYRDISVWYGVAGYAVAAGTGFFRMYNGRHWLTDVSAGAGIGILSAKIAYWAYPYIKRKLSNDKKVAGLLLPYYNGKHYGFNLAMTF